ncbi:hypothetical protein Pelo_19529 [Pelomyxa schiedti]|nr:hypothetical protein Pelo_19529 [Pelomyxa schiedti]
MGISSSVCIPLNDAIFVHPTWMSHWRQLPCHHHTGQENCTWNFIQLRKIPRGVDAFLGHDIVISIPEIEINGTWYQ